jgi:hypothetical protein
MTDLKANLRAAAEAANEPYPRPLPDQDNLVGEVVAAQADDAARRAWRERTNDAKDLLAAHALSLLDDLQAAEASIQFDHLKRLKAQAEAAEADLASTRTLLASAKRALEASQTIPMLITEIEELENYGSDYDAKPLKSLRRELKAAEKTVATVLATIRSESDNASTGIASPLPGEGVASAPALSTSVASRGGTAKGPKSATSEGL